MRGNDNEQKKKKNDNQDLTPGPTTTTKKKSKVKHINKWKHSDLPVIDDLEWNLPMNHRHLSLKSFLQMVY